MPIKARKSQDFVPIEEIRDGVLILQGGEMRAIILASSVNLSLKSALEQEATLAQFKAFLNTLDFSVQICVQSRRLDIRPYLGILQEKLLHQTEPLLKLQTKEYIEFIRAFVDQVNIMTKNFFLVVPYTRTNIKFKAGFLDKLFSKKSVTEEKLEKEMNFEEKRSQLEQRVAVIQQGLARCDVKSVRLNTEATIEAFYKIFNPGESDSKISVNQR